VENISIPNHLIRIGVCRRSQRASEPHHHGTANRAGPSQSASHTLAHPK
jgi:hypothetical protein